MDKRVRSVILLTPISLLYAVLIGGGFFIVIKESFGYIPNLGFDQLSFEYYKAVVQAPGFIRSLVMSLLTATIAASLSMILGAFFAFILARSKKPIIVKRASALMRFGIIMPYLYMVFLVSLFFSQSGLVSRLLHVFTNHQPQDFPNLIYGSSGVVLVFVLKGVPFVTMLVYNVMSNIKNDYGDVAMTLGSKRSHLFRKLYMPLAKDTIVWTGMVLFAYDLGSFEVPYILSQLKSQTFSVKLFSEYLSPNISSIPLTMAMTVVLFLVGIISVTIFALTTRYLIGRLQ